MAKTEVKKKKTKWATIQVPVGSIVVVPKEVQALKKHGIDLKVAVQKVQKEQNGRISKNW